MITILKKWDDTNTVAFEYEHRAHLLTLSPSDSIKTLTDDQLIELIESYIDTNLIQRAA